MPTVCAPARLNRVIKKNPSSKRQVKFIERESSILKAVDHEHIVKTLDIFDRPDSLVIVTEFLEGGELFSRIIDEKCFTEQKARDIMRQILLGVQYLHSLGIVHRYVVVAQIVMLPATFSYQSWPTFRGYMSDGAALKIVRTLTNHPCFRGS